MIEARPTFSESWYRVAALKVRLRAGAQISRQFYRGDRWYVVRDPAGNQYHRLSDAAYRFVGLLDGTRTVAEAWDLVGGQLADDAPTQPEVIQILSQLHTANLIETNVTPDAMVLLRRHKEMQKRQMQGRLMNLLFPRIPLWDPDRFLRRWMPVMGLVLSKLGGLIWIITVIAGLSTVMSNFQEFKDATSNSINPSNWLYLWLVFVSIKFIHELGHAFSCRRFGGECHELGIMFLVFIPTPYVDASSAWAFPNKWHRMFVGAAGMVFELFVASICAFIWANTSPSHLINQLAFNAMLIASVTTILFNANPLLRYDGYYMLSDWLEIPNLQNKSTEYAFGLIKRHIFRLKARSPLPPPLQRAWLFVYSILSGAYRAFVGVAIILIVAWKVPVLGILMAISGMFIWMVLPILKLAKYLLLDPELHRKRTRATAFSLAVAAAVIVTVGIIPFWVHYYAEGIVEPENHQVIATFVPGFVSQIPVHDGQILHKGDPILVMQDDQLDADIARTRAALLEQLQRRAQSRVEDQNREQSDLVAIAALKTKLDDSLRKYSDLTLRAPIDGRLIAPHLRELPGRYLPRGVEVGLVASSDRLVIKALVDQSDAQLKAMPNAKDVQVRFIGALADKPLTSTSAILVPGSQSELPHPSLGVQGGGEIMTSPRDPTKPQIAQFEIRVTVDNPSDEYLPGQRAYIRMTLNEKRPLVWQWYRRLLQLIETKSAKSEWT
ncbi:MAG TPA: PqqD family peptide modification chaperone [Tepidisphaeraceae bacterium]|jgi:putative peptide zinc metalloprotease protein|nr:PqqD family peptide modification chaperone [Tepidisphaeraceae bacterium]